MQLYEKVHEKWQDQPSKETPVMAADLEHIEEGIYQNSNGIAGIESKMENEAMTYEETLALLNLKGGEG